MSAVELLTEMFEALSPEELRQAANKIAAYADEDVLREAYREVRDDERNTYEEWPGVVTYREPFL